MRYARPLLGTVLLAGLGLALPNAANSQELTAADLEEWIRSGYEFNWSIRTWNADISILRESCNLWLFTQENQYYKHRPSYIYRAIIDSPDDVRRSYLKNS